MAPRPLQLRSGKLLWVCRFAAGRRSYKGRVWFMAFAPSANVLPYVARVKSGGLCQQSYLQAARGVLRVNARLLVTLQTETAQ